MTALKITSYLADFKDIEKQSRTDIVFLLIFFILLFIPMSKINNAERSIAENRRLAVYKPLINKGKINYNFGKDYDRWFSDRFNLREETIEINKFINFIINRKAVNGYIDNNTGFLYMDWEFNHIDINLIRKNFEYLIRLNNFCKNNNIKLYILITPQKTDIYIPNSKKYKIKDNSHNEFLSFINNIHNKNELKVIYPYNELKTESEHNFVFFKTEHHWTDDGAFTGYKELMKEIKKDFPQVKVLTQDDYTYFHNKKIRGDFNRKFQYGTTCNRIHIPKIFRRKYHKVNYRYYKNKDFKSLKIKTVIKTPKRKKIFYYPDGTDLKVIMLGTSQNENLSEFIPYSFKNTIRMRLAEGKDKFKYIKYYEEEILDYKPEIIIYCIPYLEIKDQYNLFSNEE